MPVCEVCGFENRDPARDCEQCGTPTGRRLEAPTLDQASLFRALVAGVTLLRCGSAFFYTIIFPRYASIIYSEETLDGLAWAGHGAFINISPVVVGLAVFLEIAASVGLWRFSIPARFIYSGLIIVWWCVGFLCGFSVGTAIETSLYAPVAIGQGAILAMMWTKPLSDRFVNI